MASWRRSRVHARDVTSIHTRWFDGNYSTSGRGATQETSLRQRRETQQQSHGRNVRLREQTAGVLVHTAARTAGRRWQAAENGQRDGGGEWQPLNARLIPEYTRRVSVDSEWRSVTAARAFIALLLSCFGLFWQILGQRSFSFDYSCIDLLESVVDWRSGWIERMTKECQTKEWTGLIK